jgi:hypothetical protein
MRAPTRLPSVAALALLPVLTVLTLLSVLTVFTGGAASAAGRDQDFTIKDPRITESSGLAASHLHPGIYWTHNDSGYGPHIYAVDSATGETVARITLSGIGEARDVEAISIGPDGDIYVGDIGDNLDGTWDHVWIYRLPEPEKLVDATVRPTQYTVQYADGPRNAEAMMVDPKTGRVYIASKRSGGGGIYEGPAELSASGTNTFRRIADTGFEVTDGALSPDGSRLVLRGYFSGTAYVWADGRPGKELSGLNVPLQLSHPQGESVTFTRDGRALMFGTEGAGSPVMRRELTGELLPDSVTSASASPATGKSGAETGAADDSSAAGSSDSSGSNDVTVGVITIALLGAAFLGLRKLLRK